MKKIITLALFISLYEVSSAQVWNQKATYPGAGRGGGSFSIPSLGMGYCVGGASQDFWEYDTLLNSWTQLPSFPGLASGTEVAFSINGKGYAGTGVNFGYYWDSTMWVYDPGTVQWSKLAHFPGAPRGYAVGFALDGKGYIGCGVSGTPSSSQEFKDFYEYDPSTNTWTQIADYPGGGSQNCVSFVIGDKAYVGTGLSINTSWGITSINEDFWEYDTTSKVWTQVADFGGGTRSGASGLATCNKGYVGLGCSDENQSVYTDDFWQYNPANNTWTQLINYGGPSRAFAPAFVLGKSRFVGLGVGSSNQTLTDLWEYIPANTDTPSFSSVSSVCSGGSISFNDTSDYAPTQWYWQFPGGTPDTSTAKNPIIEYDTAGTYNVTLTAWNGCDSATRTFTNYINVTPAPPLTIVPVDTSFCSGQSATLYVRGGGSGFIWIPATGLSDSTATNDSVSASPTLTTTYMVTGIDSGGCAATGATIVTVIPSPNKPTFTQNVDTLISSSHYDNQWYRNDTLLLNDTSQKLTITIPGEYWVVVNNEANGCSTSSDSADIKLAGIAQISNIGNQFSLYPNPTKDEVTISYQLTGSNGVFELYDITGQLIKSFEINSQSGQTIMSVSDIPSGIYIYKLISTGDSDKLGKLAVIK